MGKVTNNNMEKDKGLFSFRKHPVGELLDGKKRRRRKGGRLRRSMGFLLAAALIGGTLSVSGFAVSASGRETGLCEHHTEHTEDCGYSEEDNTPCGYECRICPVEDLIADLPDKVTEDNAEEVRAQLDKILALYRELDEDEQEQIDLSRVTVLQGALDGANAPMTADGRTEQQDTDEASVTIGTETLYYTTLEEAFAAANAAGTASVELLSDTAIESKLYVYEGKTITLNCGNYTLSGNCDSLIWVSGNLVFTGGTLKSTRENGNGIIVGSGTLNMTGGTIEVPPSSYDGGYAVFITMMANTVTVSGGNIGIGANGLQRDGSTDVRLSGGKYGSCVLGTGILTDLLAKGYAFWRNGKPEILYLDDSSIDGPVTVAECTHPYEYVYTPIKGTRTHKKTCPACGSAAAGAEAEPCTYTFSGAIGICTACEDRVSVAVYGTENLVYDGTGKEPGVTVIRGETALTVDTDYTVAYADNKNAGTATVTVTIGNGQGTYTENFSIGRAAPTITWSSTTQELTYTGQQAAITVPTVTLVNSESFGGTIQYSYTGTTSGTGLPTAAGTYTVRAHVDAAGNYNAADSTNELALTIIKADAEITVGTAAYDVNYGDPAFTISGVTDTNPEAGLQYAVTEGTDVISVSNGTVTIRNAGTAAITVSLPETANYNAAANKTITITVAKKGGYTVREINKKHYYDRENTAEINLAALLPRDCGTVTYGKPVTSGDVTFTAKAVENGMLSYALAKGNVNDAGTITVNVTTRNYEDITATVKVVLTDQIPVGLKEGTEVTLADHILTYGESLSGLGFNKAVFVGDDGETVEGILAWKDAAAKPDAGTTSAVWVFTPTDKVYASAEGTAAITVNKAVPAVSAAPTVADRIYNPSVTLKGGDLTSVTVTGVDGSTLEGTWGWQGADIVPAVNNSGYVAVFTPKDTTNYEIVSRTVTVTVEKATPYIAVLPIDRQILIRQIPCFPSNKYI